VKELAGLLRKIASALLPRQAKNAISYLARVPKRLSVHWKKARGKTVSKQDIVQGLKQLGIRKGDTIFVHSSLSAFGYVESGPKAVIEALLEAVGPDGNLCMPSFGPLPDGKTFDVRKTRSAQGKVSEIFWKMPNVKRSLRPSHSVACFGKDSGYITTGHELDKTPFGRNSPYWKMKELGGKAIALGSPLRRSLTCNYVFEDLLGSKFPVKVYKDKEEEFVVVDRKGKSHKVKTLVHDISIDSLRIDHNPGLSDWFESVLLERKCLVKGKIGNATVLVYGIKCLIDSLDFLLKQGKTIYLDKDAKDRKQPVNNS